MKLIIGLFFVVIFSFSFSAFSQTTEGKIEQIQQSKSKHKTEQLLSLFNDQQLKAKDRFLVLNALSDLYYLEGDFNTALSFSEQSLLVAQKHKLQLETGQALKNIGIMHYSKADIDSAIVYYKQALTYYDDLETPILRANVLNNIALAYIKSSEIIEALEYFKEAEFLYQKYGTRIDILDIKYNIALLYIRLDHAKNAIDILNEVIEDRLEIGDTSGLFLAYSDLVVALKLDEQFDEALALSYRVITYYRAKKDYFNLSSALHNISDLSLKMSLPLETKKYALEGISYAKNSQNNKAVVGCFYTLAKAQIVLGDLDSAMQTIQKSNEFIETLNNTKLRSFNDGLYSLLLMAKGEPEQAIYLFQNYLVGIKKVHSVAFNNQLAKFETNQLKQKLANLEHQGSLNLLQKENESRFKNMAFIISTFVFVILFLLYKRLTDKKIKKYLKQKVNERTIELEDVNKKLLDLSYFDGLTKLKNRRCFDEDISLLWGNKENQNNAFHILVADIDSFKQYNDTYGHVAGDKALTKVAEVLKNNIRENDEVYRYGGEEFAIIFDHCDAETAINASKRIVDKIKAINIPHSCSEFKVLTLSAGISTFNLSSTLSIEDFINQADKKLYKAKESGKNQLCWA